MQLWTYLQMPAMALGAAVSAMAAQNIGAGKWERVSAITRSASSQPAHHRRAGRRCSRVADRPALALFLGGHSPALPIARHIQLLATWSFLLFGRDDGPVRHGPRQRRGVGPLIILAIGLYPVRLGFAFGAYPWLGADALWLSFPVSSLANIALAIAFYLHGGWRKARMTSPRRARDEDECGRGSARDARTGRTRSTRRAEPFVIPAGRGSS